MQPYSAHHSPNLPARTAPAIASISGFGIGSILTPLLASWIGTKLAVAVVSIPHFIGTALRFVVIREHVDRRVLWTFGAASAAGGLVGALLHIWMRSAILGYVLGVLLVFAGFMGITGLAARMSFGKRSAWFAGALSGMFGGLVGNQGGIRSAALLTRVIASAVAEGLQARAGVGRGDGKPEADAAEPLAEWEQELLASATATAAPAEQAAAVASESTPTEG